MMINIWQYWERIIFYFLDKMREGERGERQAHRQRQMEKQRQTDRQTETESQNIKAKARCLSSGLLLATVIFET